MTYGAQQNLKVIAEATRGDTEITLRWLIEELPRPVMLALAWRCLHCLGRDDLADQLR